jgi:hypothetical protein
MTLLAYSSLPEDPKSGILLPRGAVPGFGVSFRALFAPDDTPEDRPPGMPGSWVEAFRQETGARKDAAAHVAIGQENDRRARRRRLLPARAGPACTGRPARNTGPINQQHPRSFESRFKAGDWRPGERGRPRQARGSAGAPYRTPQNTRCHHLRVSSSCHLNCSGGRLEFQPWMHLPESPIRQSPGQSPRQCRQCRNSGMRRSVRDLADHRTEAAGFPFQKRYHWRLDRSSQEV